MTLGKTRRCSASFCPGIEIHTGFGDVWSCKNCAEKEKKEADFKRQYADPEEPNFLIIEPEKERRDDESTDQLFPVGYTGPRAYDCPIQECQGLVSPTARAPFCYKEKQLGWSFFGECPACHNLSELRMRLSDFNLDQPGSKQ